MIIKNNTLSALINISVIHALKLDRFKRKFFLTKVNFDKKKY